MFATAANALSDPVMTIAPSWSGAAPGWGDYPPPGFV
jgi:hypothetical protein